MSKHNFVFSVFDTIISSGLSYEFAQKMLLCKPPIAAGFTASVMVVTYLANQVINFSFGAKVKEPDTRLNFCEPYNMNLNGKKYELESRSLVLFPPLALGLVGISAKIFTLKEAIIAYSIYMLVRQVFNLTKITFTKWVVTEKNWDTFKGRAKFVQIRIMSFFSNPFSKKKA